MTTPVLGDPADVLNTTLMDLADGHATPTGSTSLTVENNDDDDSTLDSDDIVVKFTGTNFGNFDSHGIPHSGTITEIQAENFMFQPTGTLTGMNLPFATLLSFVSSNNVSGLMAVVFAGNDIFNGTTGADNFSGFAGNDTFNLSQGGNDTANGGDGNDTFNLGAALTSADKIDGGAGTDTVALSGNYAAGLTFGATTMVNVENLSLAAGGNYKLTTNNATVAAGQTLTINGTALSATNVLTFNGAAETNGKFIITGGAGNDVLVGGAGADVFNLGAGGNDKASGGAGNDTFNLGAALTSADKIDGGAGTDTVALNGNYAGAAALVMSATTMVNVETLTLAAGHSYTLTANNATVAAGQTLTINGAALSATNVLAFSGTAETNGHFIIIGGKGADSLTGGALSDTFVYSSAAQSTSTHYDTITGFNFSSDIFDTPGAAGTITGINTKVTGGTLSTATFDANLATAMTGHLTAHHAVLFTPNAGTLSGRTFLVVDLNGVAGYQSGSDLVVRLNGSTGTLAAVGFH